MLRSFLLENEVEIDRKLKQGEDLAGEVAAATKEVVQVKAEEAKKVLEEVTSE